MPIIIRVIAPTFSERNGGSWGGAKWNAAEQIAVMYSAKDGASAVFTATTVPVARRPAATATEATATELLRGNRDRAKRSIVAP
jgi:hypothetical protein